MRLALSTIALATTLIAPALAQQPAQQQPQPTMQDVYQAGAATAQEQATVIVQLRAQLAAVLRENAELHQQVAAAKPAEKPVAKTPEHTSNH